LISSGTFDNTGKTYNISRIVNSDLQLDLEAYKAYSPMYISLSYSLSYALSFAAVTAIVVHTILYNGPEIVAKVGQIVRVIDDRLWADIVEVRYSSRTLVTEVKMSTRDL
jgi:hypothetical protein